MGVAFPHSGRRDAHEPSLVAQVGQVGLERIGDLRELVGEQLFEVIVHDGFG